MLCPSSGAASFLGCICWPITSHSRKGQGLCRPHGPGPLNNAEPDLRQNVGSCDALYGNLIRTFLFSSRGSCWRLCCKHKDDLLTSATSACTLELVRASRPSKTWILLDVRVKGSGWNCGALLEHLAQFRSSPGVKMQKQFDSQPDYFQSSLEN